jgi:Gene product 88
MTTKYLLASGNSKLGRGVYTWSIPALKTCPGKSKLCSKACYALQGNFMYHDVQSKYADNLKISRRDDFVNIMSAEIHDSNISVVRIHVSGDFYSVDYANKWIAICSKLPRTTFFAYTRSWRKPPIYSALDRMSNLPNVYMWFSCDRETGKPETIPSRVRLAYMQSDRTDELFGDLVFSN